MAPTKPLHNVVWSPEVMAKSSWGHIKWENAHLRVLIDAPEGDGLACHVGIYFRTIVWNGHKIHVGGIGGVMTREDCRRRGYASIALDAAIRTMRDNEAARFALLFCEPHNFAFYRARGWHPFTGEVYCRAAGGAHPLRGDGAFRVRYPARAAHGHDRPMRPAVVTPARRAGGLRRARAIICHP